MYEEDKTLEADTIIQMFSEGPGGFLKFPSGGWC